MPNPGVTSKPGRHDSAAVGVCGAPAERLGVVTAMACGLQESFRYNAAAVVDEYRPAPGSASVLPTRRTVTADCMDRWLRARDGEVR